MSEEVGKVYDQLGGTYLEKLEGAAPMARADFIHKLPPGSHVIDIGCAGGRDSEIFAHHGKVTGIDVAETFVKAAQQRVPGGTFYVADALAMPFEGETFDAAWANAVFVHLEKEQLPGALRETARVLKSGATFFLRVKEKHVGDPEAVAKANEGRASEYTYFSKKEVEQALEHAGFVIDSLRQTESSRRGLVWIEIFAHKK